MSEYRSLCVITEERTKISGAYHYKVVRTDGFTVYMDEVYLFALRNLDNPDLKQELATRFALSSEEAILLLESLVRAGFIEPRRTQV